MAVQRRDILESLKERCFDRMKSKRKSMLVERRK
jgi:hypothetical protein